MLGSAGLLLEQLAFKTFTEDSPLSFLFCITFVDILLCVFFRIACRILEANFKKMPIGPALNL